MSAKAASESVSAVDFLAAGAKGEVPPVCAVFGDDGFLKRLVLQELKKRIAGDDPEFSATELAGPTAEARDVFDELSTLSLFGGGRRGVIIDEADDFVSRPAPGPKKKSMREMLEDYVAKPSQAGVLILDVATWPSNTRLYKAVGASGLNIECRAPTGAGLIKWLVAWAKQQHDARLQTDAAESLADLVGAELGLLDQELAKLAAAACGEPITVELVDQYVGSWRTRTAWDMIDDIAFGNAPAALKQLDRLIVAGEHPIALLAQMAATFRRFAAATRILEDSEARKQRLAARQILELAGFKPFVIGKAEGQWKQLGRRRSGKLYDMLLETDLALKGKASQQARARLVLEQFIAKLSTAGDPRKA